jgi:tetrapyrrole methylase family protein/MazG family protein
VVGLGPAGKAYLTTEVRALHGRCFADERTCGRPAIRRRMALSGFVAFDHLYESAARSTRSTRHRRGAGGRRDAAAPDPIVYAVPGSPLVAERTVELLRATSRVDLTVIPGLSFLDLAWERLGIDPLVRACAGRCRAVRAGGRR